MKRLSTRTTVLTVTTIIMIVMDLFDLISMFNVLERQSRLMIMNGDVYWMNSSDLIFDRQINQERSLKSDRWLKLWSLRWSTFIWSVVWWIDKLTTKRILCWENVLYIYTYTYVHIVITFESYEISFYIMC